MYTVQRCWTASTRLVEWANIIFYTIASRFFFFLCLASFFPLAQFTYARKSLTQFSSCIYKDFYVVIFLDSFFFVFSLCYLLPFLFILHLLLHLSFSFFFAIISSSIIINFFSTYFLIFLLPLVLALPCILFLPKAFYFSVSHVSFCQSLLFLEIFHEILTSFCPALIRRSVRQTGLGDWGLERGTT